MHLEKSLHYIRVHPHIFLERRKMLCRIFYWTEKQGVGWGKQRTCTLLNQQHNPARFDRHGAEQAGWRRLIQLPTPPSTSMPASTPCGSAIPPRRRWARSTCSCRAQRPTWGRRRRCLECSCRKRRTSHGRYCCNSRLIVGSFFLGLIIGSVWKHGRSKIRWRSWNLSYGKRNQTLWIV